MEHDYSIQSLPSADGLKRLCLGIQSGPKRWQNSHDQWLILNEEDTMERVESVNWLLQTFQTLFKKANISDRELAISATKDTVQWLDEHRETNALLLEVNGDLGSFISWWRNESFELMLKP